MPVFLTFLLHDKDMEPIAQESFTEFISKHHENVSVKETGLHIHPNYPFIGATPNDIIFCSYHGESLLEIKCPFKYRENLKGWEFDKNFPISASGEIEKSHRYYYQMQQPDVCNQQKADIFLYLVKIPQTEKLSVVRSTSR